MFHYNQWSWCTVNVITALSHNSEFITCNCDCILRNSEFITWIVSLYCNTQFWEKPPTFFSVETAPQTLQDSGSLGPNLPTPGLDDFPVWFLSWCSASLASQSSNCVSPLKPAYHIIIILLFFWAGCCEFSSGILMNVRMTFNRCFYNV